MPGTRASGSRKFAEQLAPVVGRACEGTQHSLKGADRAWNSHSSRKNVLSKSAAGKTQAPIFAAVLNVNILHLIVISSAGVTILPLLREARGRSLPPSRLFGAVPFALATATLLLAMGAPETREPRLWLAGLLVGTVLGAVRGSFLRFQLDRMYSRLRLPKGRDGLWAACMLAFCTLVSFGATLASLPDSALEVGATSAVAACAGYLTGRAAALWRRSLSAPHQNLHHFPP